nr:type II toxin-antitoxin system PemK/MazF family toxin [Niveispirillum sp. BGYR6]
MWRREYLRGQEEGSKDRPCAVILVTTAEDGEQVVTVLPITHRPPTDARLAVEIPTMTKQRLGLDGERSWVVLTEANRFFWPGPDLRPLRAGDGGSVAYGLLPQALMADIRQRFIALIKAQKAGAVPRTE